MNLDSLKDEQRKLAEKISLIDGFKRVKYYGGVAQAFVHDTVLSCVVVCDSSLKLVERNIAEQKTTFPYRPGFQAYREMPAMLAAYEGIVQKPDVILVQGHGILHPRRLGIASHFGLTIDTPTIGVAKKLLVGRIENGKAYVGTEHRGFVVRTKEHANPLVISPGYKVSLGTALKVVQDCIKLPHKLPEPLHIAQRLVNKERKRRMAST
jgi:deoxyribonuclease V